MYFVAVKMGRRLGKRAGVSASGEVRLLFETPIMIQEFSTKLKTLLRTPTRRYADTFSWQRY